MIELKGITKKYYLDEEDNSGIFDFSYNFNNNGFYIMNGTSGCGKSTLLNIIGLIETYDKGSYIINNSYIENLDIKEIDHYRENDFAYIYQDYKIIDELTVYENICSFYDKKSVNSQIMKYLNKLGLLEYKDQKCKNLSGGQKQKVSIIRAILKNPLVILADEPTGNLDSSSSKEIMDILKEISKDKLVIMVSHDSAISEEYADTIINIEDGRLVNSTIIHNSKVQEDNVSTNKVRFRDKFRFINKILKTKSNITNLILNGLLITFCLVGAGFDNNHSNASFIQASNRIYEAHDALIVSSEVSNKKNNLQKFYCINKSVSTKCEYTVESYFSDGTKKKVTFLQYDDKIELLNGTLPENENDIIVSDYLNANNKEITNIGSSKVNVVGVYKTLYSTDKSAFDALSNEQMLNENRYERVYGFSSLVEKNYYFFGKDIFGSKNNVYFKKSSSDSNIIYGAGISGLNEAIVSSHLLEVNNLSHNDVIGRVFSINYTGEKEELFNPLIFMKSLKIVGVFDNDENSIVFGEENYNNLFSNFCKYYKAKNLVCDINQNNLKALNDENLFCSNSIYYKITSFYSTVQFLSIVIVLLLAISIVTLLILNIRHICDIFLLKRREIGIAIGLGCSKKDIIATISLREIIGLFSSVLIASLIELLVIFIGNNILCIGDLVLPVLLFPWAAMISVTAFALIVSILAIFISLKNIKKNSLVSWMNEE